MFVEIVMFILSALGLVAAGRKVLRRGQNSDSGPDWPGAAVPWTRGAAAPVLTCPSVRLRWQLMKSRSPERSFQTGGCVTPGE
jgi:hypothetical protein